MSFCFCFVLVLLYFWFAVHRHRSWASASSLRSRVDFSRSTARCCRERRWGDRGQTRSALATPPRWLSRSRRSRTLQFALLEQSPLAHPLAAPASELGICDGPRQPDQVAVPVPVVSLEQQVMFVALADDTTSRVELGGEAVPVLLHPGARVTGASALLGAAVLVHVLVEARAGSPWSRSST